MGHRAGRVTAGTTVLVLAGVFIVAAGFYAGAHWIPSGDDALTLVRVRSVWSAHSPLIGLPGRIGTAPDYGSHPGPLSFYALWPAYALFGRSAWALQVSSLVVQFGAVLTMLLVVYRRGARYVPAFGLLALTLVAFYGPVVMSQPWNPFLPTLWWVTFLVALWAVMCADAIAAPIAVVAGSFCIATHISYGALVPALLVVAAVALARRIHTGGVAWTRRHTLWLTVAGAVGVVLWLPPLVDQLAHSPGNLRVIIRYFGHPPESPIGLRRGVGLLMARLDPWNLVVGRRVAPGSGAAGLGFLVVWVASVVVAQRRRWTDLVLLDVVIGAALVVGVLSLSRIFGPVFWYLMLWSFGIVGLMLLTVCWTAVKALGGRAGSGRAVRLVSGTLVLVMVVWMVGSFVDDVSERPLPFDGADQAALRVVVPSLERALDRDREPPGGARAAYVLSWTDPYRFGNAPFAVAAALLRSGYPVRVDRRYRRSFPADVLDRPGESRTVIHVAVGQSDASAWRRMPGVREIAHFDPRSADQRALFDLARRRGMDGLRAAGRQDLVGEFLNSPPAASIDSRLPPAVRRAAAVMYGIGEGMSVFVGPPRDRF